MLLGLVKSLNQILYTTTTTMLTATTHNDPTRKANTRNTQFLACINGHAQTISVPPPPQVVKRRQKMPPKRLICSVCRRKFGTENAGWTHIAFKHSGTGAELNIQENIQSFMVPIAYRRRHCHRSNHPSPLNHPTFLFLLAFICFKSSLFQSNYRWAALCSTLP